MSPVLRLSITLRVPVCVIEYDGIGSHEIDTEAASTRAQKKKLARIGTFVGVEFLHQARALIHTDGAVNAERSDTLEALRPVLKDIKHRRKLSRKAKYVGQIQSGIQAPYQHPQRTWLKISTLCPRAQRVSSKRFSIIIFPLA